MMRSKRLVRVSSWIATVACAAVPLSSRAATKSTVEQPPGCNGFVAKAGPAIVGGAEVNLIIISPVVQYDCNPASLLRAWKAAMADLGIDDRNMPTFTNMSDAMTTANAIFVDDVRRDHNLYLAKAATWEIKTIVLNKMPVQYFGLSGVVNDHLKPGETRRIMLTQYRSSTESRSVRQPLTVRYWVEDRR